MTEKRFKKISVCGDWGIKDVQNDKVLFFGTTYEVNDTLKVLNELNDENKELKNENEQLKKENKELALQLEVFKDKLCELGVSDVKLYGKRYYTGLEEYLND